MEKPLKILHENLNQRVILKLRSGVEYHGILDGYDVPHMNLVLKNAEEVLPKEDNQIKNKHQTVIVRGDNIIYISP